MLPSTTQETTTVLSATATAACPPLPHLPIAAAESSPEVREVIRSVSTTTTDEGGGSMQMQQKTSRKRVASSTTTTTPASSSSSAAADKHVSAKPSSAKSASLGTSSSSSKAKKKKSKANNDETNAVGVMADMIGTVVKKPLRPLSSFHLFSQIEREYIIQTTSSSSSTTNGIGADDVNNNTTPTADDPNKSYLPYVPRRYRDIKLSADWYAGPGKRRKRKHRRTHGKIGFQELSRIISARWANLDTTDRETKAFVTAIAARELEEYKLEVKEYKKLLAALLHSTPTTTTASSTSLSKNNNNVQDETCSSSSSGDAAAAATNNDVRVLTKSSHKVTRVVSEPDEYECI